MFRKFLTSPCLTFSKFPKTQNGILPFLRPHSSQFFRMQKFFTTEDDDIPEEDKLKPLDELNREVAYIQSSQMLAHAEKR